tara:strand:+ start:58 stop:159 length:102 start_codon:yes stop_codon:yes gene_type:complete
MNVKIVRVQTVAVPLVIVKKKGFDNLKEVNKQR